MIVTATVYNTDRPYAIDAGDPRRAVIARYAWGDDYHVIVRQRLDALVDWMRHAARRAVRGARRTSTRGPVQERVFAQHAGLGWIGKNTCLINPELGSWLFLGVPHHEPAARARRAGLRPVRRVHACLTACPTGAHRRARHGSTPRAASRISPSSCARRHPGGAAAGDGRTMVYGCDICQDVCPWNRRAARVRCAGVAAARRAGPRRSARRCGSLATTSCAQLIEGTPMTRAGVARLRRNLAVAIGNARRASFRADALERRGAPTRRPSLADPAVDECVAVGAAASALGRTIAPPRADGGIIDAMSDQPTLAPSLLLSMPQLDDPNFARSVVLLCQHEPTARSASSSIGRSRRPRASCRRPIRTLATEQEVDVWIGGPVEPERSWILLSDSSLDEKAIRVCDGIYLSTSARVLEGVLQTPDQSRARLIAGYAGWGPGQLDEELAASAWLTGDIDLDIVFQTPARRDVGDARSAASAPSLAACSSGRACTDAYSAQGSALRVTGLKARAAFG